VPGCEWQRRLGDLLLELDGGKMTRAQPAYERALERPGCLAPHDEAVLAGWLGALALQARQFERCVLLTGRALALEPTDTAARSNRATAYEALGRSMDAAADWSRVAASAPGTSLGQAAAARATRLRGAL
jgi:Flp pilus assembly protein TadD